MSKAKHLLGKIVIVTGANAGLGFETTKYMAAKGAEVIMGCRDLSKAEQAKKEILKVNPKAKLKLIKLDLAHLDSVRRFAEEFKANYKYLDILVNNAGLMMPPYGTTKDGFELQFGINYLGHFLLTGLLLEQLTNSTIDARVISLSSLAHQWGDIYFDDLQFEKKYDKQKAYGQSKLACLMFAYELDRRLKNKDYSIKSIAVHPGVSRTNLFRHLNGIMKILIPFVYPFTQSAKRGAQSELKAIEDHTLSGGEFIGPSGFKQFSGKPAVVSSNSISKDKKKAKHLWEVSEKLVKIEYL
ncbi:oxidoreductase [Mesonia aestuariivivens]|uniref:SDR family NAD(P)-dependent oxidoreductase n=1 Tax=Mesonia aestuariivivens TaxID=2796128 RepID=A0ABS6VXT8_9FLAO|nr:oxidoreductase [Mesonia aestuariivivens]MBW2960406.1 SDR family NAD(P)-dependent oxidoreductase [Mesonia aestuariivivens]